MSDEPHSELVSVILGLLLMMAAVLAERACIGSGPL